MKTRPEWYYKQSAVIPFRKINGRSELLLITSRRKKKWIIPKGVIELGLSPKESALKEAEEEAGVSGEIKGKAIGKYTYEKWGGRCSVKVYLLEVRKVFEKWEEDDFRKRKWFTPEETSEIITQKKLSEIIKKFTNLV